MEQLVDNKKYLIPTFALNNLNCIPSIYIVAVGTENKRKMK